MLPFFNDDDDGRRHRICEICGVLETLSDITHNTREERAYHRAIVTRLVRRVILISAHGLIVVKSNGRKRESGASYACAQRNGDRDREGGIERRISRRRDVLLPRSAILLESPYNLLNGN
jgi:hypothetical protein